MPQRPESARSFPLKTIMLGVVDIAQTTVEMAEQIHARLRSALEHIDARRLMAAPDCGADYAPQGDCNSEKAAEPSCRGSRCMRLRLALHAVDAVGIVHAMLLRVQALLLPIKTFVFSGH